jgi:hypothetical protein
MTHETPFARVARRVLLPAASCGCKHYPPSAPPTEDLEWVTGTSIDRSGTARYLHLVRAKDDPARTDIRALPEHLRDRGAEWRRHLKTTPVAVWKWAIWELLGDGTPRTFNRIGVELLDKTADVLFELPPDEALWELVREGRVEHTLATPILFRRVAGAPPPPKPTTTSMATGASSRSRR